MGTLLTVVVVIVIIVLVIWFFSAVSRSGSSGSTTQRTYEAPMTQRQWTNPPTDGQPYTTGTWGTGTDTWTPTPINDPTYTTPPWAAPPPSPPQPGGMVIRGSRPGRNPGDTRLITPDTNSEFSIYIPTSVRIYQNQKTCKVCHQPITIGDSRYGWARCMTTNRLVHGRCYNYIKSSSRNSTVRNWCVVCEGSCQSNQAMRIEGKQF